MIKPSVTKGYIGVIEIPIFHNNKNIDFESIKEVYEEDIKHLSIKEKEFLNNLNFT